MAARWCSPWRSASNGRERGLGQTNRIDAHIHQRASVQPPPPTRAELEALGRSALANPRWLPLLVARLREADEQTFGDTELDIEIIEKLIEG
jgi:hypothetical protein